MKPARPPIVFDIDDDPRTAPGEVRTASLGRLSVRGGNVTVHRLRYFGSGASAPPAQPHFWLIYFEDADRAPEIYTDEAVARARFADASVSFNCTLFGEIESR